MLLHGAPGDSLTDESVAARMPAAQRAVLRQQRGLDLPFAAQYVRWLQRSAQGDLGWSTSQERHVLDVLRERIPRTLLLMSLALGASLAFGIALGAWQGSHAGSRADRGWSFVSLVLVSFPEFWIAIVLMLCFALWLRWLPTMGMSRDMPDLYSAFDQFVDRARHLVLPWLSLTLIGTAVIARFQRGAMREVFDNPFVRTARGKGLTEPAVRRHALRAALLPVIGLVGILIPSLFAGAVFVERIYAWPGMGLAFINGMEKRDYDLVAAGIVVVSAVTVAGALLAELVRAVADPRVRRKT